MLVKSWIRYAGGFGGGFAATDGDCDGYDFAYEDATTEF